MSVNDVLAIDVHGHYGTYQVAGTELATSLLSADAATVVQRARKANIETTIVSPMSGLLPRGHGDAVAGNREAWDVVRCTPNLLQWVIINPLAPETYAQADRMLGRGKCVGIKLHPDEHCYTIAEHGRELFEFAGEREAVVLVHSGGKGSMPQDFIPFANDFPQIKLILAHLGGAWDDQRTHQVSAIQMSRRGNVWTDTSSSKSIFSGIVEWAVREVGAEKILFGTDAPIYSTAVQRARIDTADITDGQKRQILRHNALHLFEGWFTQSRADAHPRKKPTQS